MEQFDVTIIGAGLAGLQCARLLGRQGLRVLLADRKSSPAEKVHTTGIFVRKTLEDFDIPEDCLGPVIRQVNLYSPAHRVLKLESKHDEFRVGRMAALYLRYLNQCERTGVRWLPGTCYLNATAIDKGSLVCFQIGSSLQTVNTRFLIGADGPSSRVARDLELDRNREWIVGVEDVYDDVDSDGPPALSCFLDPVLAPGYIAWIAYDGEQAHVGVGGYPARFEPLRALAKFKDGLTKIVDLRRARLVERRSGRIPVGGVLKRIANQRGLLIGDAAGAVSPLTAGGLDPCMRLSTFAANITNTFLANSDPEMITQYSGNRFRSRFVSRIWARRIAAQVQSTCLTEVGCAALRLPLLRSFAAHVFFGRGSFPDVEIKLSTEVQVT